jgi:MFS family permease
VPRRAVGRRPRARLADLPRPVLVLAAGAFLNRVGTFVPVYLPLALLARGYRSGEISIALAAYGAGLLVSSLAGGVTADRAGRRATICVSAFGTALALLLLARARAFTGTCAFGATAGLLSGAYRPAAAAMLADLTGPPQRATAFGLYRTAVNCGVAVGGVIAGTLASLGYGWVFVLDAGTSLVFGVLALAVLPPSRPADAMPAAVGRGGDQWRSDPPVRGRRLVAMLVATALVAFVFYQYQAGLPMRLRQLDHSPAALGLLMSVNGVMVVALQLPASALAWNRNAMPAGFLMIGAGFALTGVVGAMPLLVITVLVWTSGEILMTPAAMTRVSELAPPGRQGRYQGAFTFALSSGQLSAPAGLLLPHGLLWVVCGTAGAVAAVLVRPTGRSPRTSTWSRHFRRSVPANRSA